MLFSSISKNAKEVLAACTAIALEHHTPIIGPEHIMLALLTEPKRRIAMLLNSLADQPTVERLEAGLHRHLYESGEYRPLSESEITVSDLASRIVRLSVLEARQHHKTEADLEDLLLALFHNTDIKEMKFIKPFLQERIDYPALNSRIYGVESTPSMGSDFTDEPDDDADDDLPSGSAADESPAAGSSRQSGKSGARKGGDTPTLDKFGHDMTRAAEENRLDPVVGRETEIERLAQILSRRKKNNPILIGEPGVGKSAIVEGLALRIIQRKVSRVLFDKRVVSLDMASIDRKSVV